MLKHLIVNILYRIIINILMYACNYLIINKLKNFQNRYI